MCKFCFLSSKYLAKIDAIHQKQRRPVHQKTAKQAKSTSTTHQKATKHIKSTPKPSQKPQNGLGLLLKTHTFTPPRQVISLFALAATGVRTCAPHPPKQKAKLHRTPPDKRAYLGIGWICKKGLSTFTKSKTRLDYLYLLN